MKFKISKKFLIGITSSILVVGALSAVLAYKFSQPFKPSFYVYSSYTDQKTRNLIQQKYTYKEYGSYEEFEYAIGNNKTIAGITSDYSIINLINEGKIAPISKDLSEILQKPINNLWDYYLPIVNEQMAFFDKFLTINEKEYAKKYGYDLNYDFCFRDFVVPYFINDRVIAYDSQKILNQTLQMGQNINPLNISANADIATILKTLKQTNSSLKIQWTKNPLENVVYGSSYNNAGDYLGINSFNTETTRENYNERIDNFAAMIQKSTGSEISNISVNIFDSDSDIILNNLINPISKINAAVLYNGDALDAYYCHDNFASTNDGDRLRIARSENSIKILDAFVVSSSISNSQKKDLMTFFNKVMFNNMFKTKAELDQINPDEIYEQDGIMRIFDYVNYTPAQKGAYEYIKENYFILDDGSIDQVAVDIFSITRGNAIAPVEKQLASDIVLDFQRKLNGK